MIRLQEISRASKVEISVGDWRRGAVPKAAFPLAKKAYSLGNSFEWCVIKFNALDVECRVLIVLNVAKQKYGAILGIVAEGRVRVLCSYEYHAAEPGWHCHASCGDVEKVPAGFMRGPWVRRVPKAKKTHKRLDFGITDHDTAQRFAIDYFRIEPKGSLL